MSSSITEAFSLTHAQVLDGATAFADALTLGEGFDIYGVDQASLTPDSENFDNMGDDVVLSTWSWINKAEVEVRGGFLDMPTISTIKGLPITTSGIDPADVHEMDLWHECEINAPPLPMLIRMPARDKDGAARILDIGLYRVYFDPITFDGPQYKDGLKVNYVGRAVFSPEDEEGNVFADGKKRIGKLISSEGASC